LAAKNLVKNLDKLLDPEKRKSASVIQQSALEFLRTPPVRPYDLVFVDPPFQSDFVSPVLELLLCSGWMSDSAIIYLEQPTKSKPPVVLDSWELHRQGRAGQSEFFLYRQ